MKQSTTILILGTLIFKSYAQPQFITFKDGKLGVNFMGYHAGVGIGGLVGGDTAGGLFAEAGTPTGQLARAGLGGKIDEQGRATGGLFAGATAGGNVKASAGLGGSVSENKAEGGGLATAQAGKFSASAGMVGVTSGTDSGIIYSNNKNIVIPAYKEVIAMDTIDTLNEVQPLEANSVITKNVVNKEVQPQVVEKEIIYRRTKPRHHYRKTAFLGGYIGSQGEIIPPPAIHKSVESNIQKRIDIGAEGAFNADAAANANHAYTKQVTVERNPTFFQDIFNIPISTLKAVSSFLGNTVANTNVSVQKSATINAGTDLKSSTDGQSPPLAKSSEAHISVETPSASQFIDGIFAIPINTLSAVNKFLENNVPARKSIQAADGSEDIRQRGLGAKRRANKRVVIIQEDKPEDIESKQ